MSTNATTKTAAATGAPARTTGEIIQIDHPQLRELADRAVQTLQLAASKAIAAQADPASFPLPADRESVEQIIVGWYKSRPAARQQIALPKALSIAAAPAEVRSQRFRDLAAVNLRSAVPVANQAMAMPMPPALKLDAASLEHLDVVNGHVTSNVPLMQGSVNPVIVTPPSREPIHPSAQTPPIDGKYLALGGEKSFLGKPAGPETSTPDGKGRFRHYTGGSIYWTAATGAHEVHGAIKAKWSSMGWERSVLGYPVTDETVAPDKVGRFSHFEHGSIYWTASTGAHEVHGAIRNKWTSLGWERGFLGYPTSDETATPDTVGRFNHFQGGSVYWLPSLGAHAVHLNIRDKWKSLGWELGKLGYPITDTAGITPGAKVLGNVIANDFQGGRVTWTQAGGAQLSTPVDKLQFRLRKVLCAVVTDGLGDDDMAMSGVATDTDGKSAQAPQFSIGDPGKFYGFDTAKEYPYNPPKVVYTFDLNHVNGWPRTYIFTEMLAEIDSGGFSDVLKDLLESIKKVVSDYLSKAGGKLVLTSLGTLLGSAAMPGLGTAVGAVIGYIVGAFFDWLISLFEDDYFLPTPLQVTLPNIHTRWNNSDTTNPARIICSAAGGVYELFFDWRLVP